MLMAGVLGALTGMALWAAGPVTAQGANASACDANLGFEVLVRGSEWPLGPDVSFNVSTPRRLPQPIGPGDVVVSGVVADSGHVPFDYDHQAHEQIRVALLDAKGQLLATTAPTMDLADDQTEAAFRLPSVRIERAAAYIRVVHGGTPESFNSIEVPCINVETVDRNASAADRWSSTPCPSHLAVGREAECGFLAVPERRDQADSRLIQVAAMVIPATNPLFSGRSIVAEPPVLYLEGGPGSSATSIASILQRVAPFLAERDLVVMDQRGTGLSLPNLSCDDDLNETDVEALARELQRCRNRLERERVDLAGFTTAAAAADAAELRQALGYRKWDVVGTSYGTSVAMTLMDVDPDGVRSVAADSPLPPAINLTGDAPAATHRQFDDLIARCNIQPACQQAFPNLRRDLIRAVARLDNYPVPIPAGGPPGSAEELDAEAFVAAIEASLTDPKIPALIHAFATETWAGQAAALATVLGDPAASAPNAAGALGPDTARPPATQKFATGLFLTIVCAEELPFADDPLLAKPATTWSPLLDKLFVDISGRAALERLCGVWDVAPQAQPLAKQPSDIPLLILAAEDDVQTPISWVVAALDVSSVSNLVVLPQGGHVALGNLCPNAIIAEFFDYPSLRVQADCLADEPQVVYDTTLD